MKIVLASKSPRRKELLSLICKDFEIRVSNADESYDSSLSPSEIASSLARIKAEAVNLGNDELIIGCDTIVVAPDGEIMGKPLNDEDAIRMLNSLSGTEHKVISGICLRDKNKIFSDAVTTNVKMRKLDKCEIDAYVSTNHPTDKAGAYGIQEMAGAFIEGITGDFYNVVGLPLCRLTEILKEEYGINLISND
jgi:septum formation protein